MHAWTLASMMIVPEELSKAGASPHSEVSGSAHRVIGDFG